MALKVWKMKKLFPLFLVFFLPAIAPGQGLVTGTKKGFVPPDKVLFKADFSKCPAGESPARFTGATGAGERVRLGNKVWGVPAGNKYKVDKMPDPGEPGEVLRRWCPR